MRVLIVGTTYFPAANGQAVFTTHLADGLASRGHAVTVAVPTADGQGPYERNGVRVRVISSLSLDRWHPDAAVPVLPARALGRAGFATPAEVVHIQDHYPLSRAAARLARDLGVPVVGTNHFMPENLKPYLPLSQLAGRAYDQLLWRWMLDLFNRLDLVTAPSATAAEMLRRNGLRTPVCAISCGVDVDRFRPMPGTDRSAWRRRYALPEEGMLCLYVGRLDAEKGIDVLLGALQRLARDDVTVGIAGKGAARPALERLAATLGVAARARFLGFVPDGDLPSLLNSADLFVMPSTAELLSIATLEAMACGRPVVAAAAGALPELVSSGENGYLFAPGDAEDAARCLARAVSAPERLAAMGLDSRRRALAHALDGVLAGYEEIYCRLLRSPDENRGGSLVTFDTCGRG